MHTDDIAELSGKSVIVTGAAMGIGFGIARRLTAAGANCLLVDLDSGALAAAVGKLESEPGKASGLQIDITDASAGDTIVEACVDRYGSVDILVNNAGIFPTSPVLEMEPAFFDRVMSVNLNALVFLSKAAGARMVAQGNGGKIVNVASIDALHPSMEGLGAYDASKGAVLMFSKNFALEMAPHKVQVNVVAPGAIATEGASRPMSGLTPQQQEEVLSDFIARVPVGRIGTPDDIARVVQFLAGVGSDYMTGAVVVVDGGRLLR